MHIPGRVGDIFRRILFHPHPFHALRARPIPVSRILARVRESARTEMAGQSLVVWSPLCLMAGIWTYFSLSFEPSSFLVLAVAVAALVLWVLFRRSRMAVFAILCVLGFCLAKGREDWVATPLVAARTQAVSADAVIDSLEMRGPRRYVVIVTLSRLDDFDDTTRPHRLRLFGAGTDLPQPGDRVRFQVALGPLPTPVSPGGFDYGRQLFFQGIGGTGRVIGAMEIIGAASDPVHWAGRGLFRLRSLINGRIAQGLPKNEVGFGQALVTGSRAAIPQATITSLQISGLFHVLSISGLHMSLVAGGVFAVLRALLALWPWAAERLPIKKYAAVAGIFTALFYMALAGADVATQRSAIMLTVMFGAILLDRPALSMRNLAFSALIILITQPEAAVSAGFQMSFIAVAGLVAAHGLWVKRSFLLPGMGGLVSTVTRRTLIILAAAALTTLVAGTVSSIPAAYHFGRLSPYSLLANLLALPVVSLIVMPSVVIAVCLMPFGLEAFPLWVLGKGLDLVMAISNGITRLPEARLVVLPLPAASAILMTAGILLICLLRGRWRWAGLVLLLAVTIPARTPPDLLIDDRAANVAVRTPQGVLSFINSRKNRFAANRWLAENGEDQTLAEAAKIPFWTCTATLCDGVLKGRTIRYYRDGSVPEPGCGGADIVISAEPLRNLCREAKVRIDRFDVWRNGAYSVRLPEPAAIQTIDMETARGLQGARPWTVTPLPRKVSAKPEPDSPLETPD